MKKLTSGLLIIAVAVALQGCFGFGSHNTSSGAVPHAFDVGSESDINAPAQAGGLNSGWSNNGNNWNRPCQRHFDGSCR